MKKEILFIFCLVFILINPSCDYIEEPFFQENDSEGEIIDYPQKALIMDFTGHTCKSCPKAHQTIHMIKQVYGDKAIAVAFHLGYFAQPKTDGKYEADYRTDEGAILEDYYDFISFPIGWVNRMGKNDLIPYPSWAAETANYTSKQAGILIHASATYDGNTSQANANINLNLNGYKGGRVKMCVYLTESHIISYQKDEDASPMDVPDYEHNHLFRDAFGSVWGEEVSLSGVPKDGLNFDRVVEIRENWNPDNCSFVIFVYDPGTMEVLQAEEVELGS